MKLLGHEVPLGISIGGHPVEAVHDFAANGFTHFEIYVTGYIDGELGRGREEKLVEDKKAHADAIAQNDLCVWSVHLPFGKGWDVAHYDEKERDAVVESLKKVMDLTACWHPKKYVLHGCLEPVAPEQRPVRIARSIQSMRELDAYAAKYGARIALEDLPRSCLANTSVETRAMMLAAGVEVCFDVNHLLGDTHEAFLDALAPHITTTHLSDYDGVDERHWLPGQGVVPWKQVFLGLQKAGYRGPYLFELSAGPNGYHSAAEVLAAFKAAVEG